MPSGPQNFAISWENGKNSKQNITIFNLDTWFKGSFNFIDIKFFKKILQNKSLMTLNTKENKFGFQDTQINIRSVRKYVEELQQC